MKKNKSIKNVGVIFFILFIFIFLLVACSSQQSKSVCGNGVMEGGEACDGAGCPADKVCTDKCKCESLTPPAFPT